MNKFAILLLGFLGLAGVVSGQSLEQTTEQRLKDFLPVMRLRMPVSVNASWNVLR